MPRQRSGRPPTITADKVHRIGTLVASGLTHQQACAVAAVKPESFGRALQRNPQYRQVMEIAHAHFLEKALTKIASGTSGWQGLAWILERRHKGQFGRGPEVQVNNCMVVALTEEDVERIREVARSFNRGDKAIG